MMDTPDFLLDYAGADTGPFAGASYAARVLSYSPIAYWPMGETSGTNADNAEGTAARDGTFARNVTTMTTSTGIGDGNTAPLFDGTQDTCDVYSAGFVGDFDGGEGTLSLWLKVSGVGVWADGFKIIAYLRDDLNNRIEISSSGSTTLSWVYIAGGTVEQRNKTSMSETGWIHAAMTWSATGDAVKAYYNGAQEGATMATLGTFAGPLIDYTDMGSKGGASGWWDGNIAHPAVFASVLADADILDLATV